MKENEFYENLEDGFLNPADYVVKINQTKPQPIIETERKYTAIEAIGYCQTKGQTLEQSKKIIGRLYDNGAYNRGYTESQIIWALKELNY